MAFIRPLTLLKDLNIKAKYVVEDKNKNKKKSGGNINTIWGNIY